jgi:resuscitation-promoting factor RpfA
MLDQPIKEKLSVHSRPATRGSKGRHVLRSTIGRTVISDPVRLVAVPARPRWRSGVPIWIGLGVVVVVTIAAIIGTVPRTVTTSTSAVATTPPAQPSAVPPTTEPTAAPTDPAVAPAATPGTWEKVAQCESSGNWGTNTGNGFYGGLQFTASTWRSFGGAGMAHQASRAEQIAVGERVLAAQGWKAWPVCSRKLGLR